MGIMARVVRLFKADLHGVMDHLEDKGLLLKQHLREMEDALSRKAAHVSNLKTSRNRLIQTHTTHVKDAEKTEQNIETAIKENKDPMARRLIARKQPLDQLLRALDLMIERMDNRIVLLEDSLKNQRLVYERIKHGSEEYFFVKAQQKLDADLVLIDAGAPSLGTPPGPGCAPDHDNDEIELELFRRKKAIHQEGRA